MIEQTIDTFGNGSGTVVVGLDGPFDDELTCVVAVLRINGQPEETLYTGDSIDAARKALVSGRKYLTDYHEENRFRMVPNGS